MLTLRLLGGLSLTSSGGPVSGRASQRRRLALLAVLAVARGKPVSRDKLVALLWPDADAEHARHLLADSIYVLRDALGNDVLLGVGDDVSLNPERVGSDLAEFQMALDAGDRERAVSIYSAGGAFLDGVHVTDAPEFERWAEVTRRQVQAEYRRALESLANDAAARGKHAEAAGWWQQLAGEDPISSRVALGLMRALAASGDRAGALEFARVHESIVRAELEAPADPAVTAFANELRHTHERTPTKSSVSDRAPTTVALENSKSAPALAPSAEPATTPANAVPIRWRYRRATAAAAVLLLGLAMYSALHGRTNSSSRAMAVADSEPSIAVLPLTNIGGDSANESFAAGMTEQLIDALARSGRLRVIAATSAFAFKGHASDVRSIAESLHVRHILEGGLQREGARIRVRLGLIDAASGATRWSEKYDREMKDVFAIEDDIARAVAGELSSRLLTTPTPPRRKRGTTNLAAYESYVRGRDPQLLRSDSGVKAAIGHFQRAIALDSTYAGAYAGLAHMYGVSILDGRPGADTTIAKARVMAMRAVALDSTLAEAHYELGFVSLLGGLDLPSAAREIRRAIALDSTSSRAHEGLSTVYRWQGRPNDAVAEARLAVANDPLSGLATTELASALLFARKYDSARVLLDKLRSLRPPIRRVATLSGQLYATQKMFPQAIAELRSVAPPRGMQVRALGLLGFTLAKAGERAEAKRVLADITARWRAGKMGAYDVATIYAGLGDYDQAFVWLEKSIGDRSIRPEIMGPAFDALRADPRFNRIRQRLRLQ